MIVKNIVQANTYFDSVTLMVLSSNLNSIDGVIEAAIMMGTEHNKELMKSSGILPDEVAENISGNDLVIGIKAHTKKSIDEAIQSLNNELSHNNKLNSKSDSSSIKSIDAAIKRNDNLNFAVISLPGRFAGAEAKKCLLNNVNVLLFSDNIAIEEENQLKTLAIEKNLFMMGPDCGTAIINGISLGFANVVQRGDIGLIAASGTGLQELTVIIDKLGGGISQAIGTGGRDVSKGVNGKMMLFALDALAHDPKTNVIGIVSKPPAPEVLEAILKKIKSISKPVVVCFLGADTAVVEGTDIIAEETIEEAAKWLVILSKGEVSQDLHLYSKLEINKLVMNETKKLKGQQYVRGLFTGGTLAYEAMLILNKEHKSIYSNIALNKEFTLKNVEVSKENTIIDMGDDYFTDGMPHPMIEPKLRNERIKKEASDPTTAIILLDCVLGYGSHKDPAGELAKAVLEARTYQCQRHITYIASVCGTENDPQVLSDQIMKLENADILVLSTNAQAAQLASRMLQEL